PHRRIALAGGHAARGDLVDPPQVFRREAEVAGRCVLLEVVATLGPRDGNDVRSAQENPGQRELRGGRLLLRGDLLDALHQVEVAFEVLALESRIVPPEVSSRAIDR